ncbi:HalOD1 output domain-containing protein [Salinilacihabitans rarus]|uniref:HalOD1 output domain-containing protein n=1 Tax=Salinilacihabitans rarus TaxID=2961596 RepID=UPI0020C88411|nr:HalOD1 output domain-containing protein [Salinilacihabitans rarus]
MTGGESQGNEIASAPDSMLVSSTRWSQEPGQTPVYAIASAVADAADSDPLELPPLNEAIDPDALNTLFTTPLEPAGIQVTFRYAGYEIRIEDTGNVRVYARSD